MSNTLSVQLLFLFLTVFRPSAEHLNVNAITSDLPAGRVLGVAFSDDAKTVFIQQVPISAEKTGAADTSSLNLQLLSLSMDSHSVTAQGNLVGSSDSHGYPCGRIEAASKLQRLVTCGPGNHLDLFDSANLKTVGKIGSEQNETIQDFGLDRRRNIAFVLSLRKDSSLWLTSYSLLNGTQQHAVTVSGPARFARMSLAVEQEEGIVGLAVTRAGASGDTTEIFTCHQQPTPGCESIANVDPVTQIAFFGKQLLYVTLNFADKKHDCIMAINPATRANTRSYCSPDTGVHYGLDVAAGKYIVGYTGTSKRGFLSEEVRSVKSTFSIWPAEDHNVAAVIADPVAHGAFQNEIRIAASGSEPVFAVYQRLSGGLRIYTIEDRK